VIVALGKASEVARLRRCEQIMTAFTQDGVDQNMNAWHRRLANTAETRLEEVE
jgi:hypothetical protein